MPSAMIDLVVRMIGEGATAEVLNALRARSDRAVDMIENRLNLVPYLAGAEFTAADIMMLFPLTTMRVFQPRDLTPFPAIRAYLRRIGSRPAFQRATAKADPGFTPLLS